MYIHGWIGRYIHTHLQVYVLVITFLFYEQSFCRTEKPVRSLYRKSCIAEVSQGHQFSSTFSVAAITLYSVYRRRFTN